MNQQMGIFDWFDSKNSTEVGEQILKAYFFEASKFPEFTHPSFEAYMTFLKSRVPDIVETIGSLVITNYRSTTVGQAENRMRSLANQSGGQATIPQIVQAAGGSGDTINWFWAATETAAHTFQDTAAVATQTLQDVGEGVTGTLKLTKYLPWILLGGAALYIGVLAYRSPNISKLFGKL